MPLSLRTHDSTGGSGESFEGAVSLALSALCKSELVLTRHQKEVLKSIISRKDTFVSLPTGHGKSIIFECLGSVPFGCTDEKPSGRPTQKRTARRQTDAALNRDSEFDKAIHYVFAAPEVLDEPSLTRY